jgi:hypothetical protein
MNDRLKEYVDLHQKIERSLRHLPKDATPEQIDKNQRAFERLVREARTTARPGDIFTPEARPVIRRLLATIFGGPDGKQLKASIMDENPVDPVALKFTVNSRELNAKPVSAIATRAHSHPGRPGMSHPCHRVLDRAPGASRIACARTVAISRCRRCARPR